MQQLLAGLDAGSTTVKAVAVDAATEQTLCQDSQCHETRQQEKVLEFPQRIEAEAGMSVANHAHLRHCPLICMSDNVNWQANHSSLKQSVDSEAMASAYFPKSNRGTARPSSNFTIDFSANVANGVLQEFVLRKLTPKANDRD